MERDPENNMRLGLFGGTFDPIHYGHIRAAEEIHNRFGLFKTIFIPSHFPPHKKVPVTPSALRVEMVRLAISGMDGFELSDTEIRRGGSSYSYQTIQHFKGYYGKKLEPFFIIGTDAFLEIETWKNYPVFFSESHFIVMNRPAADSPPPEDLLPDKIRSSFTFDPADRSFCHTSGYRIYYVDITPHDISSTDIREKTRNGQQTKSLIPKKVADYIKKNALYGYGCCSE